MPIPRPWQCTPGPGAAFQPGPSLPGIWAGATAIDRIERLRATLAEFNGLKGSSIKEDAGLRSAIKSMMHDSRKLYFFIWFYAYYEDS